MSQLKGMGYMWVEAEDYDRFLELFAGNYPATYKEFCRLTERRVAELGRQGVKLIKVPIKPDAMRKWIDTTEIHPGAKNPAGYVSWVLAQADTRPPH